MQGAILKGISGRLPGKRRIDFVDDIGRMRVVNKRVLNIHCLSDGELAPDAGTIVVQNEMGVFFIMVCKIVRTEIL
mgnify:CR=1 FL=1